MSHKHLFLNLIQLFFLHFKKVPYKVKFQHLVIDIVKKKKKKKTKQKQKKKKRKGREREREIGGGELLGDNLM